MSCALRQPRNFADDRPRPISQAARRRCAWRRCFTDARTHNAFLDKPVPDELLTKAVELAKMGPTSANQSPMRVVFLRSRAAKERLAPALSPGNLEKTMAAPVVAIAGYDLKFYEHLPFLFPHADAKSLVRRATPAFAERERVPERHVAGRLSHPGAARRRPRHRPDDRLRQRQGRRRVLSRGTTSSRTC